MSDEPPKKPDEAEARRALVKAIEEFDAAHPDWREGIHITPEGKWGTPWPEGTKDDPPSPLEAVWDEVRFDAGPVAGSAVTGLCEGKEGTNMWTEREVQALIKTQATCSLRGGSGLVRR